MKVDQIYRINGFEQIKAFYSWVFNSADLRITPQHISLYLFLVNQNNRCNWAEWFKCPMDTAMAGSCIGNKKTYYSCVNDMVVWELIEYKKGTNEWKSPLFKLVVLKSTSIGDATVPQPTPQLVPQVVTLPTLLLYPVYKQLTDNIKLITDNLEEILIFLKTKESNSSTDGKLSKEIFLSESEIQKEKEIADFNAKLLAEE